jgi:hypothetical protein
MWALGVIATVVVGAGLVRYFTRRDNVPPMERHIRALDALRNLAEQPRPPLSDPPAPDTPTDHVRILTEAPDDPRPTRRVATRRSTARPAWVTDLPTISIRPGAERPDGGRPGAGERPDDERPNGERPALPAAASPAPTPPWPPLGPTDPRGRGGRGPAVSRSRVYAGAAAAGVIVLVAIAVGFAVNGRDTKGGAASRASAGDGAPSTTVAQATTTSSPSTTAPSNVAPVVTRTNGGATVSLRSPFLLTLRTTAACWVQITDASGTIVFTATLPAGQQQQIPGAGPIVMKLGNMSGVTISVGDVPLDLGGLPQTADITFQTA